MNKNQDILIRNKQDVIKLSTQTTETLKISRQKNLNDAIQYNNMLYINTLLDNVPTRVIIRLLIYKIKKRIKIKEQTNTNNTYN